jgi:hypothetical protein
MPVDLGVDGFGMSPEEAAKWVAAGKILPPLGVYRDAETWKRYQAALKRFEGEARDKRERDHERGA